MKKLLRYLKNYLKETIIGPFFKLLEASFELIIPLVVAQIIDIGIKDGDIGYIATRALIMIGLGLVAGKFIDGAVFCGESGNRFRNGTETFPF